MNCGSPLLGIDPVTPDMPGPSAVATTITTECTSVEEKPTALDLSQYPTVVCMLYVHAWESHSLMGDSIAMGKSLGFLCE